MKNNKLEIIKRINNYNKDHCWQYDIRLKNLREDLKIAGLTESDLKKIKVEDFNFSVWDKQDKETLNLIRDFIYRHEWLGSMPQRFTHIFMLHYKGHLAGVLVMATPNAFSKILGESTKDKEKLIARGACISWSPKNLASHLIMKSINWMVKNTKFRIFSAYSDPDARELGTIYQACNFIYLGQKSGGKYKLFDPNFPEKGYFSDREIRKISAYKRYSKELNIDWQKEWTGEKGKINWHLMSTEIENQLRKASKEYQKKCQVKKMKPKHKYIYLKGRNKSETKQLKKKFIENNKFLNFKKDGKLFLGKTYPKEDLRGF